MPAVLYISGGNTANNFTPRNVKKEDDTYKDIDGASSFDSLERAVRPVGTAQTIDTAKLGPSLETVYTPPPEGHWSIRPKDDNAACEKMIAWIESRENWDDPKVPAEGQTHAFTDALLAARTGSKKRPK